MFCIQIIFHYLHNEGVFLPVMHCFLLTLKYFFTSKKYGDLSHQGLKFDSVLKYFYCSDLKSAAPVATFSVKQNFPKGKKNTLPLLLAYEQFPNHFLFKKKRGGCKKMKTERKSKKVSEKSTFSWRDYKVFQILKNTLLPK